MVFLIPTTDRCPRCGADVPSTPVCDRCAVEMTLAATKADADLIPALEARLAELGGAAPEADVAAGMDRERERRLAEFLELNPDWDTPDERAEWMTHDVGWGTSSAKAVLERHR